MFNHIHSCSKTDRVVMDVGKKSGAKRKHSISNEIDIRARQVLMFQEGPNFMLLSFKLLVFEPRL